MQIESTKPEDTFAAGEKIGSILKGGEVIQLVGDLGAGKTSLVRGLAHGLGSIDEVASPSFTISREYSCRDDITLHHFDFYRLDEPGIMLPEIQELIGDPKVIVAVEWGEIVDSVMPENTIQIEIKATDELSRLIKVVLPLESSEDAQ